MERKERQEGSGGNKREGSLGGRKEKAEEKMREEEKW